MFKILQARLQQYVNYELPEVQAEFRKGRGTRVQIVNIHWIIKNTRDFQKNIYFCFIDYAKTLTVWITTNCRKFFKRWDTRLPDLPPEKSVCRSGSKLELDPEQQTGFKLEKEYVKAVYCHPAYLTYIQSTSREKMDWMKHKQESRLLVEISITSDMQMTPSLWQKAKKN